jgi:Fic family protein
MSYPIPMLTLLETRLHERLTNQKTRLDALRPLPTPALQRLREQMTTEWIYNSNAIEGSTLTLRETQMILKQGLTIGGKSLREHFEVINHKDAIDYVETLAQNNTPITAFHVRQIHQLVMTKIDDNGAGQYRSVPVRIVGAAHQPPEAWEVSRLITEWAAWLRSKALMLHPIDRAAIAHHKFVAIHPFTDGNGRTGRLIMNLILMREGYPPTVILKTNRKQYYRVLAQADAGNDKPIVNFVGRAVERSLQLYIEASTPRRRTPAKRDIWLPLSALASESPYSQEYLSLLARSGKLRAMKRGRVWYSTRQAIQGYIKSLP